MCSIYQSRMLKSGYLMSMRLYSIAIILYVNESIFHCDWFWLGAAKTNHSHTHSNMTPYKRNQHSKYEEMDFKCDCWNPYLKDYITANAVQNMISNSCNLFFALNKVWISIHDSIDTHTQAHFRRLILYWFSMVSSHREPLK